MEQLKVFCACALHSITFNRIVVLHHSKCHMCLRIVIFEHLKMAKLINHICFFFVTFGGVLNKDYNELT